MKIEYIEREIHFADLLGDELPEDVKWILNYFKDLTHCYEKKEDGLVTWYNKDGHWTIQIWEEREEYVVVYFEIWDMLHKKYNIEEKQIHELVTYLLQIMLNRKLSALIFRF